MKNVTDSNSVVATEGSGKASPVSDTVRPLHTLESQLSFDGEKVSGASKLTLQEGIRLGVSMVIRGEESRARGIYVLADKSRSLKGDELTAFMGALKSELVNESVSRVNDTLPAGTPDKLRDKAKKEAQLIGERRYDNLGQSLRAARFALDNPKAVANGVSVFTVQQALAYTKAPALKEGEADTKEGQTKMECHKVVAKLLATPGTSQNAIKAAVSAAKDKVEKKFAPVDTRSEEKKSSDARTALIERLPARVVQIVNDIDGISKSAGVKPLEWRSAALEAAVRDLARLAGVECVAPVAKK